MPSHPEKMRAEVTSLVEAELRRRDERIVMQAECVARAKEAARLSVAELDCAKAELASAQQELFDARQSLLAEGVRSGKAEQEIERLRGEKIRFECDAHALRAERDQANELVHRGRLERDVYEDIAGASQRKGERAVANCQPTVNSEEIDSSGRAVDAVGKAIDAVFLGALSASVRVELRDAILANLEPQVLLLERREDAQQLGRAKGLLWRTLEVCLFSGSPLESEIYAFLGEPHEREEVASPAELAALRKRVEEGKRLANSCLWANNHLTATRVHPGYVVGVMNCVVWEMQDALAAFLAATPEPKEPANG